MAKIKVCPFCGETFDFGIMRYVEEGKDYPTYCIMCMTCGATGPKVYAPDQKGIKLKENEGIYYSQAHDVANRKWNERHEEGKNERAGSDGGAI